MLWQSFVEFLDLEISIIIQLRLNPEKKQMNIIHDGKQILIIFSLVIEGMVYHQYHQYHQKIRLEQQGLLEHGISHILGIRGPNHSSHEWI